MRQHIVISTIILLAACAPETPPGPVIGADGKMDLEQVAAQAQQDAHDNMMSTGQEATNDFKNNLYGGAQKLKDWLLTPPQQKPPRPVKASYCYYALQDILCYRQPMPGWEFRLVGYQGTGAAAPPPAMMKPLPTRENDKSASVENRVTASQPVFKEMPAELKEEAKPEAVSQPGEGGLEAPPLDSSHQTLPNPTLAPQL